MGAAPPPPWAQHAPGPGYAGQPDPGAPPPGYQGPPPPQGMQHGYGGPHSQGPYSGAPPGYQGYSGPPPPGYGGPRPPQQVLVCPTPLSAICPCIISCQSATRRSAASWFQWGSRFPSILHVQSLQSDACCWYSDNHATHVLQVPGQPGGPPMWGQQPPPGYRPMGPPGHMAPPPPGYGGPGMPGYQGGPPPAWAQMRPPQQMR